MNYAFESLTPLFVTSQFNTSASPEKIQMDWKTRIISELIDLDSFVGQIRGAEKQKIDNADSLIHSNRWE